MAQVGIEVREIWERLYPGRRTRPDALGVPRRQPLPLVHVDAEDRDHLATLLAGGLVELAGALETVAWRLQREMPRGRS